MNHYQEIDCLIENIKYLRQQLSLSTTTIAKTVTIRSEISKTLKEIGILQEEMRLQK